MLKYATAFSILRAALASLLFAAVSALAQQAPAPVEAAARALIELQTQALSGEIGIEIAPLDPANHLPPCPAPVAFLPGTTRAWGAFSVGMRCEFPAAWTIYLQARVRVIDTYLITARALSAGQIVGPGDLETRRGDLAALPDDVLTDASQASGRTVRHALAPGNPLQTRMLRIPDAVRQGSKVTVFSRGQGFQVSNSGRALNSAAPGEPVKVRLPNNQVISGTARLDNTVEIDD
jgi:flagella basal body P-ring formation protein FlgA